MRGHTPSCSPKSEPVSVVLKRVLSGCGPAWLLMLITLLPTAVALAGAERVVPESLALRPSSALSKAEPRAAPSPSARPVTQRGMALKMTTSLDEGKRNEARVLQAQTPSPEPLLGALLVTAQSAGAGICLLLLYSVAARAARQRRQARERQLRAQWQPVLYARMAGDEVSLPALAAADRLRFLMIVLDTLGQVRDEAADAVVAVAKELGLAPFVVRLLSSRMRWKRLIAIQCAAAFRLTEAIDPLMRMVARNRPRSSLAAAAALLRIDPGRGLAAIAPLMARLDWSPGAVAAMLKRSEVPSELLLVDLLQSSPPDRMKQVLKLMELIGSPGMLGKLREIASSSVDPEVLAAAVHALGSFGGAEERDFAAGLLGHPNWLVRMQSARALGALGTSDDARLLEPLLCDPQWWVRYRGAQALLQLAGTDAVRAAAERTRDESARVIVQRVIAEQP